MTGGHPPWGLLSSRTSSAQCSTFAMGSPHSWGGPQTFGWPLFHYFGFAPHTAHCSDHTDCSETSSNVKFAVLKGHTLYVLAATAGVFTTCHVVIALKAFHLPNKKLDFVCGGTNFKYVHIPLKWQQSDWNTLALCND